MEEQRVLLFVQVVSIGQHLLGFVLHTVQFFLRDEIVQVVNIFHRSGSTIARRGAHAGGVNGGGSVQLDARDRLHELGLQRVHVRLGPFLLLRATSHSPGPKRFLQVCVLVAVFQFYLCRADVLADDRRQDHAFRFNKSYLVCFATADGDHGPAEFVSVQGFRARVLNAVVLRGNGKHPFSRGLEARDGARQAIGSFRLQRAMLKCH